jgi:hypothetical protein
MTLPPGAAGSAPTKSIEGRVILTVPLRNRVAHAVPTETTSAALEIIAEKPSVILHPPRKGGCFFYGLRYSTAAHSAPAHCSKQLFPARQRAEPLRVGYGRLAAVTTESAADVFSPGLEQRRAARAGGEGEIATRRLTASSSRRARFASVTGVPRLCRPNPRRGFCIPPAAKTQKARCAGLYVLAERAGFEPAEGYEPSHAFQACDLNRSSTSPAKPAIVAATALAAGRVTRPSRSCAAPAADWRASTAAGSRRLA